MKDDELKRMGDAMREQAKERGIEFRLLKPRTGLDELDTDPNSPTFGKTRREAMGPIHWSSGLLLNDHDDVVDAAPRHLQLIETPSAPFWKETWFWEQVVYVLVCLGPAMVASYLALAAKGPVSARDIALLAGSNLLQFVAQKARSAAARQAALSQRTGFVAPEIRCAPKVKRWSQAGQVLGAFMAVATAPSWWHVPSVIWALFAYDLWRSHRERQKNQVLIGGF